MENFKNEEAVNKTNFNLEVRYPNEPGYEITTRLEKINLDLECREDLDTNNGFMIYHTAELKKDLKSSDSIFSSRFGPNIQDMDKFNHTYKCECGDLVGEINDGITCPCCGKPVKYVGDNFDYRGWIVLKEGYNIIHPAIYKSLCGLIGKDKMNRIICPKVDYDKDGHIKAKGKIISEVDEPFVGIGILDFKDRFDEIMDFYYRKYANNTNKMEFYNDIMNNRDKIFIRSIPVFTTLLRPFKVDANSLYYSDTNAIYNMMASIKECINQDSLAINRKKKPKIELLYTLQEKYMALYAELEELISSKKGLVRTVFGGRYSFTSRVVIVQNPTLEVDQITLPYKALVHLEEQTIKNILHKSHNLNFAECHRVWEKASIDSKPDRRIVAILNTIIENYKRQGLSGAPYIINRNPTINFGSIMCLHCVGFTFDYIMGLSLQILAPFNADFDGDSLNVLKIINRTFLEAAEIVFNPKNSMFISKNDGLFNNDLNHKRDLIINMNTLIDLSRGYYNPRQLAKISQLKRDFQHIYMK